LNVEPVLLIRPLFNIQVSVFGVSALLMAVYMKVVLRWQPIRVLPYAHSRKSSKICSEVSGSSFSVHADRCRSKPLRAKPRTGCL
ncbi:MAG: hypothetical protein R6V54_13115, partial [Desulfobacteraceae bacterium]